MQAFFKNVAKAKTVKTILQQCYGDKSAVTDELVRRNGSATRCRQRSWMARACLAMQCSSIRLNGISGSTINR